MVRFNQDKEQHIKEEIKMKEQHTEAELRAELESKRVYFNRVDLAFSAGSFFIVTFIFGFGMLFGLISGFGTYYISSNKTKSKLVEMERNARNQFDIIP